MYRQNFIRRIIPLALLAVTLVACSPQSATPSFSEPAKAGPSASADGSPAPAPSVSDTLAQEAGVQRIVYHIGPVDLPAGMKATEMLAKPLTMRFQTDKALWVTGFIPKVVDATGGELPSELLHHAIVFNMHEENPLCAGSPNPFAASTGMLTEVNLPQGYGYPILPTDPIEAKVVLANPTKQSYVDVSFELTLVAKPMSDFSSVKDVKPIYLELDPCSHAPMPVEPKAFAQKSATYQMPVKGNIVAANGILQDFGAAVQLIQGTAIMPFWRAEGVQNDKHQVTALTDNPYADAEGIAFKSGDQITLGVSYDNNSDEWLSGASAGAMVYLTPKD